MDATGYHGSFTTQIGLLYEQRVLHAHKYTTKQNGTAYIVAAERSPLAASGVPIRWIGNALECILFSKIAPIPLVSYTGLLAATRDSAAPSGLVGVDSAAPSGLVGVDSTAPSGLVGVDSNAPKWAGRR